MQIRLGIVLFISFYSANLFAQNTLSQLELRVEQNPDSVKNVVLTSLNTVKDQRKKIGMYHLLGLSYFNLGQTDSATYYLITEDSLLQNYSSPGEPFYKNQTELANVYYSVGNLTIAEIYYQSALSAARTLNNYETLCQALLSCGWISREQGRHAEALDFYFEAIHLAEINNDENLLASSYAKIAIVYNVKGDLVKAREYYYKALAIRLKQNNMPSAGSIYNNIGLMHDYAGQYDSAIWFFKKAMHISDSIGDSRGVAIANENIGLMYYQKKENLDDALKMLNISLSFWRSQNDIFGQCQTLVYMVFIYNEQKKYNQALDSSFRSLELASKSGANDVQQQALEQIYLAYQGMNKPDKALEYYLRYDALRDSLHAQNTLAEIDKLELQSEFDSKQLKDSIDFAIKHEQQETKAKADLESGKFWNRMLLSGIIVIAILAVLIFYVARHQRKTALYIEKANLQLKSKNKEIIDSINYARRIQLAILPSDTTFKKVFNQGFIFYQPKDIVAGDFYWLAKLKNTTLFAVADCTGHGVPGAMVSVICANALNKVVNEMGVYEPAEVLNKVTDIVIETFAQSDHELKDGMDISLISIDNFSSEKNSVSVKWAGANNGLWILSNYAHVYDNAITVSNPGTSTFLHEIKPTKQPVGKFTKRIPFRGHDLTLHKNDQLILFTDGYADQFGGEKNKKFKYSSLKKLLLSVAESAFDKQREALKNNFDNWKGNMEQIDDVCVIGIKL